MSKILTGTRANVTTPLSATVSSIAGVSGAGSVWEVTTTLPHLFGTGDYGYLQVTILGVSVSAWGTITVIDATHFTLSGTTYSGTGTGTAYDLGLTPQIQVPTDGSSFSLQISGMLSALQALCDRTQALRYMMIARAVTFVAVSNTSNVVIPPWANAVIVDGCGGGGGGGGGPGGILTTPSLQYPAGGAGAGARRTQAIFLILGGATSVDVTIGAGGAGGAGSAGGASPLPGTKGSDGGHTMVAWHDGSLAGTIFSVLRGGSGGGGGGAPGASSTGTPTFTPGGPATGTSALWRSGASALVPQTAPGYRAAYGLNNASGTITGPAAGWDSYAYTDPVGPMDYYEGGASVANAGNATYAAAVSYSGAPGFAGEYPGGTGAAAGAAGGSYPGGAGGGGGGAGSFGAGGAGGTGGAGSSSTGAGNGTAGTSAGSNSGGGGGGGGGGGNGASSAAGDGAAGGNGGSGFLNLIFVTFPTLP